MLKTNFGTTAKNAFESQVEHQLRNVKLGVFCAQICVLID